uniref:(California timema) hypothetical protein n=1 Tax=Timema californicum TaxID=61474 RepID=A0A7R9PAX5_TIMCA|nr:unnamed protein product [Timema californicum]
MSMGSDLQFLPPPNIQVILLLRDVGSQFTTLLEECATAPLELSLWEAYRMSEWSKQHLILRNWLRTIVEEFGTQINLCLDQELSPGPIAQKSDTLPLDHQLCGWGIVVFREEISLPIMHDKIDHRPPGWRPYAEDSGSESHPLLSSSESRISRTSFGVSSYCGLQASKEYLLQKFTALLMVRPALVASLANALVVLNLTAEDEEIEVRISVGATTCMFPDSETSDLEFAPRPPPAVHRSTIHNSSRFSAKGFTASILELRLAPGNILTDLPVARLGHVPGTLGTMAAPKHKYSVIRRLIARSSQNGQSDPPRLYGELSALRPFAFGKDVPVKRRGSMDGDLSSATYNRFQFYSKLRSYSLESGELLVSSIHISHHHKIFRRVVLRVNTLITVVG